MVIYIMPYNLYEQSSRVVNQYFEICPHPLLVFKILIHLLLLLYCNVVVEINIRPSMWLGILTVLKPTLFQ